MPHIKCSRTSTGLICMWMAVVAYLYSQHRNQSRQCMLYLEHGTDWIGDGLILITCKKAPATDSRACCGHGSNQSMTQLFTRAGKFLHRRRRSSPTGDMASTICRFCRHRSVKAFHRASLVTNPPCEATCNHYLHVSSDLLPLRQFSPNMQT